MRKFGFDRNGVSIGSKAHAQAKISCGRMGLNFLPDGRIGAAVGHLIEVIEELENRLAVLEAPRAVKSDAELVDVRSLPVQLPQGQEPPEHLRGDYRRLNGEQRRELKQWREQHAA